MALYKALIGVREMSRNMIEWEEWKEHCYEDLSNDRNIPFCNTQNTLIIPNTTKVTVIVIMMNSHWASKHSKAASSQHELDLSSLSLVQ